MKRVVIESPLSGDFENKRYALWCAYHCYTLGEAAYASHLIFPQFLDDERPEHRGFGIQAGYAWGATADLHAFYLDLGWSEGMKRAHDRFDPHNPTVVYRYLPQPMLDAFERGELPTATRGFRQ